MRLSFHPPSDAECRPAIFPASRENMMKVRVILVCTLLLLVAVPTFALPLCAHCNDWNQCESAPGDFERCVATVSSCGYNTNRCSIPHSPVLADWTVASIEITRPSLESVTITAPAPAAEVPAATPAAETTELK
jgi:hypothetical protein